MVGEQVRSNAYLIVSIEAEQGGGELGIAVHYEVHLNIRREGADVVVLDAAQLQVKQRLQHMTYKYKFEQ